MTSMNTDPSEPAVFRFSTRAIMNCVFLFFLCCFICLGYIVLHQNEYMNGGDGNVGVSYIVTDHQNIMQAQAAPAASNYRSKIINIEDVEIGAKNSASEKEETDAEKLWKQFGKFRPTNATEKIPTAKRHLRS